MKKLHALFISLALGTVFAAVPAMASATVVIQKTASPHEVLPSGAAIQGLSSNLVFKARETGGFEIKCTESKLTGKVTANSSEPSTAKIESATFTEPGGGACATTTEIGKATITAENLPWVLSLKENKEALLTAESGSVTFHAQFAGTAKTHCTYSSSSVLSAFKFEEPLAITVHAGDRFSLSGSGNSLACPAEGELTAGKFKITSSGSEVEAVK